MAAVVPKVEEVQLATGEQGEDKVVADVVVEEVSRRKQLAAEVVRLLPS